MNIIIITWLIVGLYLVWLNESELINQEKPIGSVLAMVIVMVFAPLFIVMNLLEIILGLLVGSEDDDC